MYTIGEAAKRLNVTPSTLRYYDKEGLLPFVDRTQGNVRRFKDADFRWLELIECLKATGMPIKDIKRFVDWCYAGDDTMENRREMFHERKRIVEEEIARMQRTLETINYKCWYYDTACQLGSTEAVQEIADGDIPPEIRAAKTRMEAGR